MDASGKRLERAEHLRDSSGSFARGGPARLCEIIDRLHLVIIPVTRTTNIIMSSTVFFQQGGREGGKEEDEAGE